MICPSSTPNQEQVYHLPAISDLSLEEKAGQVIVTCFHGDTARDALILIRDVQVGGIILFDNKNDLTSPEKVARLTADLQKTAAEVNRLGIPLLISLDQEGGIVQRLKTGFTQFPGNRALTMADDLDLAEKCGAAIAVELNAVNVALNLAPVVDVNSNPNNPVIGIRSFGPSPEQVAEYGRRFILGSHSGGVLTTIKHFPGHGDVDRDSHIALPLVDKSMEELERCELIPFKKLAPLTDAVMPGHLMVTQIDRERCATVSPKCYRILRDGCGFSGAIITDCLTMGALKERGLTIQDVGFQALKAGCDLLLCAPKDPSDMGEISALKDRIVAAVKRGELTERELDQSIARIFGLKSKMAPLVERDADELTQLVGTSEHRTLALRIARRALRAFPGASHTDAGISHLQQSACAIFAPKAMKSAIQKSRLFQIGKTCQMEYLESLEPTEELLRRLQAIADQSDILIAVSPRAARAGHLKELIHLGKPIIHIACGETLLANPTPEASLTLSTFSPSLPSLIAARDYLIDPTKLDC